MTKYQAIRTERLKELYLESLDEKNEFNEGVAFIILQITHFGKEIDIADEQSC